MGATDFFKKLFGDLDENYLLIWTLKDKKSRFFKGFDGVESYIESVKATSDVYFGVGLSDDDYGAGRRCLNENIAGIGGLWLDIDIKAPSHIHKKQNLPPSIESAFDMIHEFGQDMYPTAVIHSGNGVQAYWMFKEPWIFDTNEEREEAASLVKRFIYTFKGMAARKGWDVDSVIDLARVLRIPGTLNHKTQPPKPTTLLKMDDRLRYDPSDFEPFLIDVAALPKTVRQTYGNDDGDYPFTLNDDAEPPFEKFEAMCEIEPKFAQSWKRSRRDLQDQSASSYDLSLASFAALASWTDQEIVDLLIAARRKHGDDLKLRKDYYARTIKRSRSVIEKTRAQEEIEDFSLGEVDEEKQTIITEEKRLALLKQLSVLFNVKILRIVRYAADPPTYKLETIEGGVMLGDVGNLIDQSSLRKKVASVAGRYIPRFKGERWDAVAQALLDVCETEHVGEEATTEGATRSWVEQYLEEKTPVDISEVENQQEIYEYISQRHPIKRADKGTCIFAGDLKKWLKVSQMENVTQKELGVWLRGIGATPDKINYTDSSGIRTSKSIWILPSR